MLEPVYKVFGWYPPSTKVLLGSEKGIWSFKE